MERIADIGVVGLGTMGENLALNLASNGFKTVVYNRHHPSGEDPAERFMAANGSNPNLAAARSLRDLTGALETPRIVLLMIKAGSPVDDTIDELLPFLTPGDIVIDGGNSFYKDTERRVKRLGDSGIRMVGCGISGGAYGARHGASIMPGGNIEAWQVIRPILQAIAAELPDGTPCCEWMGNGGSGHFVKMVHNGIEYGDMQLIAECFDLLSLAGNSLDRTAEIFDEWNRGDLQSYLIEITPKILRYKDTDGTPLLLRISDRAGNKGTGIWCVEAALQSGTNLNLIAEALFMRLLSNRKTLRQEAARYYPEEKFFVELSPRQVGNALYAARFISYAQGFGLLRQASDYYGWHLPLASIATIWREGCIIRSRFLAEIAEAYDNQPELSDMLFADKFRDRLVSLLPAWREVVSTAIQSGVAVPCLSGGIAYFDALRRQQLPTSLIQAQRDFFGAHTYERNDQPEKQFFHTDWDR